MDLEFREWVKFYNGAFHKAGKHHKRKKKTGAALQQRLWRLGYQSYEAYLASPHWYAFWHAYYSYHPHICFITGLPASDLHHVSYERLGHENFDDVIPVSHLAHELIHHVSKVYGIPLLKAHLFLKDVVVKMTKAGLIHPKLPKLTKPKFKPQKF
jgi:hypothetical protein